MTPKNLDELRAELVAEYGGEPTGRDALVLDALLSAITSQRALADEVVAAPTVTGSRGQPVPNPAAKAQADLLARVSDLLEHWNGAVEYRRITR